MFQRVKDAIAFESEFSRWEHLSQIRTLLVGNRVAEIYGQSASYGKEIDVYLMRDIFERIRPETIQKCKRAGLSSRHAVLKFLCDLGDAYLKESGLDTPPKQLLFPFTMLVPVYDEASKLIPDRWSFWINEELDQSKKYFEEQQSAAQSIAEARNAAAKLFGDRLASLNLSPPPNELLKMWLHVPDQNQQTERWIASECGLSLKETMAWLNVLQSKGVVTVIGTALTEPKYWKTPLSTLDATERKLRDKLDTYA
jgi:hypothetical protein